MDETGVLLDYKPGKVIAANGAKYLHSHTRSNQDIITIICAMNAAGKSLPPHVIVKGQTRRSLNSLQTKNAPKETTWSWSDSSWTKQGIALLLFKNSFLPHIGEEQPPILTVNGHNSHNFSELIDAAFENNVHIIELPAHTSNWLFVVETFMGKKLLQPDVGSLIDHFNSYYANMPGDPAEYNMFARLTRPLYSFRILQTCSLSTNRLLTACRVNR